MHCHDYQHWQADRNDEEAAGIAATTVERLKPKTECLSQHSAVETMKTLSSILLDVDKNDDVMSRLMIQSAQYRLVR